jgi:SNF2 family DNA or RNA helicase
MLSPRQLFPYQQKAIEFQCAHPASSLWLDMGLGKTAITLTSIGYFINSQQLRAVLIVAPIRVCRLVWRQEALKWLHTQNLRFSMVVGDQDQRSRALLQKADVYLVNYENLEWLVEALETYFTARSLPFPFDGVVFDEISKCKNSSTNRVKALRKILPEFKWRTGLTGTPASNGFKDLHGQYLVLDDGQRLGTSKSIFEGRYYKKNGHYKSVPFSDTEEQIKHLIGDMTLEMSAEDYNPLPDLLINDVIVELSPEQRAMYDSMEREFFLKLDNGSEIELFNQASLMNKCLQFSNGFVYPVPGDPRWEPLHELKLDALEDIIEEANGQPVLCSYAFRADAERIMRKFHKLRPINLTDCHSEKSLRDAMHRWKTNDCRLMIGHPASMGHGIDGLQQNGHILVWYGLNWSLDLVVQFNARIRRQGQGVPVICHRILCRDTLDQAQSLALDAKASTEASLRKAIKDYRLRRNK